jgi:hypothetical protein
MLRITIPRRPTPLITTAMLALAVPLITYGALRSRSIRNSQPANAEIETIRSPQALIDTLEVELLTLRPAGFEPSELTRSKGSFVLFIDDRSGKEHSLLVLQRSKGERVRAVSLNREKSEWHDLIDLSPGDYVLQDASNPDLHCLITIRP